MKPLRLLAHAALLSLAVLCGTAGQAQQIGSLIKPSPGVIPENGDPLARARIGMNSFAACLATSARNGVNAYLMSVPGSPESTTLMRRLVRKDCLSVDGLENSSGGLEFSDAVLRGALYEAVYQDRFGRNLPGDLTAVPAIDYVFGTNPVDADDRQDVALRRFADCVTRSASGEVHTLILSRPASSLEKEAMRALMPKLSGCLSKDLTIKFSKVQLRGVLGETLYRIRAGGEVAK